jgi:hypothetical protein
MSNIPPNPPVPDSPATPPKEVRRDEQGQFLPGTKGGPGNPFARQVAALRKLLLAAVTPEDFQTVAKVLLDKAKSGDEAAIKLLLLYTIGKPATAPDVDRLNVDEWKCFEADREVFFSSDITKVNVPSSDLPLELARRQRARSNQLWATNIHAAFDDRSNAPRIFDEMIESCGPDAASHPAAQALRDRIAASTNPSPNGSSKARRKKRRHHRKNRSAGLPVPSRNGTAAAHHA